LWPSGLTSALVKKRSNSPKRRASALWFGAERGPKKSSVLSPSPSGRSPNTWS